MLTQYERSMWKSLRTAVVAADSAITTFDYDSMPAALTVKFDMNWRTVQIAAFGKGTENGTAAYTLYARNRGNGPLRVLATGTFTFGTLACTKHPLTKVANADLKWFDTIASTAGELTTSPTLLNSAVNQAVILQFDRGSYEDLYLEIGTLTNVTQIDALISGY